MIKTLVFCSGALLLAFSYWSGETTKDGFPSEEVVQRKMDALLENSDLPALVAMAVNDRGERITYTYGEAVWNTDTALTTRHIFRIASMTKLITSIAALQLVEQDSLGLDEDLSSILPEMAAIPILTDEGKLVSGETPITLRQLLTHTSGFGYFFTDSLLAQHDVTDWDFAGRPRRFESGTRFLYGRSTDWVGRLVEKVTGQSLEEYFRHNITGPLGMDRTWFNVPDALNNQIVSYGRRGDDGTAPLSENPNRIPAQRTSSYNGGGGLYSSPEDYGKLLECLLHDGERNGTTILLKETVDELFRPQLKSISMDISQNYFLPGLCCDFRGLIPPTANWGLGGLIDTDSTAYGRQAGTMLWGGIYNTYWYVDRRSGIAATVFTQHLPFNHPATISVFEKFSEMIYGQHP